MTKQFSNYSDLLTYTRASKGHALRPVSYGDELVTNGTFDSDTTGWTAWGTQSVVNGKLYWVRNSLGGVYQSITTKAGSIYVVDFTLSGEVGSVRISPRDGSVGGTQINNVDINDGTQRYIFVALSSTTVLYWQNIAGSGGEFYLDDVSAKEVLFDQPDGTLTLFEHPNGVPRVEYDADGNRLGLLVEEQRTTLVTSSEDFSGWSNINAPLEANSIEAPDGTVTATKLIANTENGQHRRDYPRTYSAGTYTFSVFAKVGGYNYLELRLAGDGVYVDIRDGSFAGASAGITTSYEDVGNGWKRIAITHSAGANDTARINVVETSGQRSFTGDGTSGIYIWGAQLEEGAFPTSYIKTTGSTATRSADVASIPVADFGFNADAGSFVLDAKWAGNSPDVSAIVHLGDSSDRHLIYYNSGSYRYQVKSGDTVTAQITASGAEENDVIAASYKKDSFFFGDGSAINSDTSGALPAEVLTTLDIGGYLGDNHFNGHIKSIKYYPRQLTSAQLGDLVE